MSTNSTTYWNNIFKDAKRGQVDVTVKVSGTDEPEIRYVAIKPNGQTSLPFFSYKDALTHLGILV